MEKGNPASSGQGGRMEIAKLATEIVKAAATRDGYNNASLLALLEKSFTILNNLVATGKP